jgi:hypothetical protein
MWGNPPIVTILQYFPKIQELLAILELPNHFSRLEIITWFLVEKRESGLLEVVRLPRKNWCFKTCFGSTDGDDFQNFYIQQVSCTKIHPIPG